MWRKMVMSLLTVISEIKIIEEEKKRQQHGLASIATKKNFPSYPIILLCIFFFWSFNVFPILNN